MTRSALRAGNEMLPGAESVLVADMKRPFQKVPPLMHFLNAAPAQMVG